LPQRLHFDGAATANVYRSKKSDKSKHSETLIFKLRSNEVQDQPALARASSICDRV
jgi:hypothetical protein